MSQSGVSVRNQATFTPLRLGARSVTPRPKQTDSRPDAFTEGAVRIVRIGPRLRL
jgi:hypothetical protein